MAKEKVNKIIELFDSKLDKIITETTKECGIDDDLRIRIGYNKRAAHSEIDKLSNHIDIANVLYRAYCEQFDQEASKQSYSQFEELLKSIPSINPESLDSWIREQYLIRKNIQIPSFPNFKISALVKAYDFDDQAEQFFTLFVDKVREAKQELLCALSIYFNGEELELTDKEIDRIKEHHALFIDDKQIEKLIALRLLCVSLNTLREEPYTFKDLPEIDHRLMKFFDIDNGVMGPHQRILKLNLEQVLDSFGAGFHTQFVLRMKRKS